MDSDSSTLCLPYHGSCTNCHHFHINARFSFSRDPETHTRLKCERCGHSMFGLGRTSIQSSLASIETVSSWLVPLDPPHTVPEVSTTKESLPSPNRPEFESSNTYQVTSLPPKKLASPSLFKGIANKISRPFRKRMSRTDQRVDNETETQSGLTEDHEIRAAHLRARRREKTLDKFWLQNDGPLASPPDTTLPDYLSRQSFSGSTEAMHTGSLFSFSKQRRAQRQDKLNLTDLREKGSSNSLNSINSCVSVRSSVSISYTSGDGRRKKIEHRTHSAVEVRKIDLSKAKYDTMDFPSQLRQRLESLTRPLSPMRELGSAHGRSSSLSMLPQANAAQSMNLDADDPRRTPDPLEQERDLAKESWRRFSLPKVAPLPLQHSYPPYSSGWGWDEEIEGLSVRTSESRSSLLPDKAAEDANSIHGPEQEASIAPPYDHSSPVWPQLSNADGLDRSSDLCPPSPNLPQDRSILASIQSDEKIEQSPPNSEDHPLPVKSEQGVDEDLRDSRITRMNDKVFRLRWRCVSGLTVSLFSSMSLTPHLSPVVTNSRLMFSSIVRM